MVISRGYLTVDVMILGSISTKNSELLELSCSGRQNKSLISATYINYFEFKFEMKIKSWSVVIGQSLMLSKNRSLF